MAKFQNLLFPSDAFASWTNSATTTTSDVIASPITGAMTGDLVVPTTGASVHYVSNASPTSYVHTAIQHTFTVYAKNGGYNALVIQVGASTAYAAYDLTSGVNTAFGSLPGVASEMESVGNGWWRCTIKLPGNMPATNRTMYVVVNRTYFTSNETYAGDGVSGVYLAAAQAVDANWAGVPTLTTTAIVNQGNIRNIAQKKQNLLTYSQTLENVIWNKTGLTVLDNQEVAPDGTTTAAKLTDSATALKYFYTGASTDVGTIRTLSFYAKAGTKSWFAVYPNNAVSGPIYFNVSTGVVGTGAVSTTVLGFGIEPAANGFYRCYVTYIRLNAAYADRIYMATSDGGASYVGDGTGTIYLWGVQAVQASVPGPYTVTTSATVNTGSIRNIAPRQNIFTQSQTLSTAPWAAVNATITADQGVAPDGTVTADQLDDGVAVGVQHYFNQTATYTLRPYEWRTTSIYIKPLTGQFFKINHAFTSLRAVFDVVNGTVSALSAGAFAWIEPAANGYYKCSLASQNGAVAGAETAWFMPAATGTDAYLQTFNGANRTYLLWGAQHTSADHPTGYIATGASRVDVGGPRLKAQKIQNLLLQSQTFENASWVKAANVTATDNSAVAPDGTTTAALLNWSAAADDSGISQTTTYNSPIGTIFSISMWVRAVSGTAVVEVYLTGGAIMGTRVNTTVGETWQKITTSYVSNHANTQILYLLKKSGSGNVYVWGAQYVNSNDTQGYVPTTTAKINTGPLRLIAQKKQNNFPSAEDFTNASWVKLRSAISSNAITAPDGTMTADGVLATSTSNETHLVYAPYAAAQPGELRTIRVFAKAGAMSWLFIYEHTASRYCYFDLSGPGAIGSDVGASSVNGSASIRFVGDGWYECTITSSVSGVALSRGFAPAIGSNDYTYTAADTTTPQIYLWGATLSYANTPGAYSATSINTGNIRNAS